MACIRERSGKRGTVFYIDYRTASGKRRVKRIGPDRKAAEAARRKVEAAIELQAPWLEPKKDTRLVEFFAAFSAHVAADFPQSRQTRDLYEGWLLKKLRAFCDSHNLTKLGQLTPQRLTEFVNESRTGGYGGRGLSATSTKHLIRVLKTMFSWAEREGYVEENPTRKLQKIRAMGKPRVPFTQEEKHRILEALQSRSWLRNVFEFLLETGLRTGEFVTLQWRDYKPEIGTVEITAKPEIGFYVKERKPKRVFLSPRARSIVESLPRGEDNDFMFLQPNGKRIDNPHRHLSLVYKELGIAKVTHCTRNTFITEGLARGIPPAILRRQTGHSSNSMLARYEGISDESVGGYFARLYGGPTLVTNWLQMPSGEDQGQSKPATLPEVTSATASR